MLNVSLKNRKYLSVCPRVYKYKTLFLLIYPGLSVLGVAIVAFYEQTGWFFTFYSEMIFPRLSVVV